MSTKIIIEITHALTDMGHNYYYDKLNNRVVILDKHKQILEYGSFQACQLVQIERTPENFVAIEPISDADEFEWMNEFAASLSNNKLILCLSGENPFEAFFVAIEVMMLKNEWQIFYNQKVISVANEFYQNLLF